MSSLKEYLHRESDLKPSCIYLDGKRIRKSKQDILAFLEKNIKTLPKEVRLEVIDESAGTLIEEFLNECKAQPSAGALKMIGDVVATSHSQHILDPMEFIPVINWEDDGAEPFILVHAATMTYTPNLKFSAWRKQIPPDDLAAIMSQRRLTAVIRYNPHCIERVYSTVYSDNVMIPESSRRISALNTYNPPKWKLNPIQRPTLNPLLRRFFEHLIPDPECRKYLFQRIWYILNKKLEVFLVLNGGTGVGKGLFTDELMKFGVGEDNSVIAPESWDKSHFNGWLLNKQLVVLDEVKVISEGEGQNVNMLKRLINERQNIELKGKDANSNVQSYASFFITSNHGSKNFTIEDDNRRFSVLDITDVKFEKAFSPEEAAEIVRIIREDDEIRGEFFWYIQHNFAPTTAGSADAFKLWKGPTYKRLQFESKARWQQMLITVLTNPSKTEYTYTDLKDEYENIMKSEGSQNRFTVRKDKIESFLKSYVDDDAEAIGTVVNVDPFTIKPNKKYVKESTLVNEKYNLTEVDSGL